MGKIEQINRTLFASQTIFGWTFQGKINNPCNFKAEEVAMKIAVEDSLSHDFRSLWELDSLGINDKENNLEDDQEIINEFENQCS